MDYSLKFFFFHPGFEVSGKLLWPIHSSGEEKEGEAYFLCNPMVPSVRSPECPPQVSSAWSSEVHVAPHSEPGECLHENSQPYYHLIEREGWKEALGFSYSILSHLTDGVSQATERLLICARSHSKLRMASVQNPCPLMPVCCLSYPSQHLFAAQFTAFSSHVRISSTSGSQTLICEVG